MTHCSQETGNGLADVLFGDANPAGRLVQTWPRSIEQLPAMMDYDIRRGRTYMYFRGEPLYPFGHGLSYTSFEYANLHTSAMTLGADAPITISVDVRNTGDRDGEEVVQLYAGYVGSAVERPVKQLVGFKRIAVPRGPSVTCEFVLHAKQIAYWDSSKHRFVVEPGKLRILVGASSADIRLGRVIDVT